MPSARLVLRAIVVVAVLVVVGMRLSESLPYRFRDTGTVVPWSGGAGCFAIDLDGDRPGAVRPVAEWPYGAPFPEIGDRVAVTALLDRSTSGDIDPCNARERLVVEAVERLAPSPAPG